MNYVAHTPPEDDPKKWQSIEDLTARAADFAANWAEAFGTAALAWQRRPLISPPQSVEEFLATLSRQGLARTVEGLRPDADLL